ncbi:hypothetical protein [Streptomyces camelliae]|uniref:Cation/H+ exchanger domain-containing protein n=1 Tax=Streptomyces camelliae TaxID=3004093 RepID=A0ABY7P242_9ACTN|nr:hypothetical protein [Streptomyces sp. HUAS 2-6]WBO64591.1 hypothetical protein O1G22_17985 [Streptomyces sp. HUAS 2-6]
MVSGLAGFRGAVSLAAALSGPQTLDSGEPFPDRGFIVFVTSGVILVTLMAQGLLLPAAARWAKLPPALPQLSASLEAGGPTAPPSSASVTNAGSTTPYCPVCRPPSATTRSACPES